MAVKFRLAIAALLALSLASASAAPPAEHESVRREVQSKRLRPLAEILQEVQQRHKGRVIDIELERGSDGRRWYEIKLANGQRTEIYVDAVTGQDIPRPGATTAMLIPMSAVVAAVTRLHPGTVLQVELEETRGPRPYYEIQLLTREGREQLLRADAQTGRILVEPPLNREQAATLQPLPRILEELERKYQARATEAELKFDPRQRAYYEIELQLSAGRSIEVHVDAYSGQPIEEDGLR